MSDDLQKFVKEREKHLKSSQESLDNNKGKDPSASKMSAFGQNESKLQKWWRSKRETQSKSENDGCDLLYESMIKDMLEDHTKETRFNSSVVVINSFDQQRGDIEEIMDQNHIYTDVMEIDRLNTTEREEYLMCFNKMFNTRILPLVFVKDKLVANGYHSDQDLKTYFNKK